MSDYIEDFGKGKVNNYECKVGESLVSVTEWRSGEGFDVVIGDGNFKNISITHDEWKALQICMLKI